MRIGYVGLSTPLFYDYRYQAALSPSDLSDSPNPIIEGAFGAMLLYDELWFACGSACPENMRSLDFVRLLDETGELPEVDPDWLGQPDFDPAAVDHFYDSFRTYDEVKRRANVYWDAAADNHTHGIQVGRARLTGDSINLSNVVYDMILAERLPPGVELLTNSFTSGLFEEEATARDRLLLTEVLVLDGVPQFLTPKGPYHPCVDEVRDSAYLRDFRKWVSTAVDASPRDVLEMKVEVEAKLTESLSTVFLNHLDRKATFTSVAKTAIAVGVDLLVPEAGAILNLMGQLSEERRKQGLRWQGFLIEARSKVRNA